MYISLKLFICIDIVFSFISIYLNGPKSYNVISNNIRRLWCNEGQKIADSYTAAGIFDLAWLERLNVVFTWKGKALSINRSLAPLLQPVKPSAASLFAPTADRGNKTRQAVP
jgi:hypothetical protein